MKISILIVNWNSMDLLRKCLNSIRATTNHILPQIVVVDGGSYDGSAEMLADDFPEVEFIQSSENIGFGRSNNLGFERVTGDALLLLNPDTEVRKGAIDVLRSALESLPDAGLIGARLLNTDGSLQYWAVHSQPTPWNAALDSDLLRKLWWMSCGRRDAREPFVVDAVAGACMMIGAETYRALGGFDTSYFMYAEDMDLCYRIRKSGLRIYHAPQALVQHHGGGSSRSQCSKFSEVMTREALCHYFRKHHGHFHSALFKILIFISAISRMIILSLYGLLVRGEKMRSGRASIEKWRILLGWSLGNEKWAADYFKDCGNT